MGCRGCPITTFFEFLRNFSSDYAIALQHWGHQRGLACLRENPLRSLRWDDPNEVSLLSQGGWYDFDYDACFFLGGLGRRRHRDFVTTSLSFFRYPVCDVDIFMTPRNGASQVHDTLPLRRPSTPHLLCSL